MKTESDKQTEIIVPLGQALKDARIASSLSIDEVAKQLNFAPSTIVDFEENLEEALQSEKYPVIYLRGYLANYAKLVGLNTLELFVEYQQLASVQKKPQKLVTSKLIIPQTKKRSLKFPIFIFLMIIIGVFLYLNQKQVMALFDASIPAQESTTEKNLKAGHSSNVLIAKGELHSKESDEVASEVTSDDVNLDTATPENTEK